MNTLLIFIIFVASVGVNIFYFLIVRYYKKLDMDLLNAMSLMSSSLREGDSLETAITKISHGTDRASRLLKKIIQLANEGLTFKKAFESVGKKINSVVFTYLSRLIALSEDSDQDISEQLDEISTRLNELQQAEENLSAQISGQIMVLQILVVFILPIIYLFLPTFFDLPIYQPNYYYMGFVVVSYSLLNYITDSDLKKSIILLPLFVSGYLLMVTKFAAIYLRWLI